MKLLPKEEKEPGLADVLAGFLSAVAFLLFLLHFA